MTEPVAAKPDQQTPASNAYTTSDHAPSKFGTRVYFATDSDCKRSGFTLIETVTMFSLMSVLAISSLSILNAISQNGIELAQSHQTRRDALRLADSVREDAESHVKVDSDLPMPDVKSTLLVESHSIRPKEVISYD